MGGWKTTQKRKTNNKKKKKILDSGTGRIEGKSFLIVGKFPFFFSSSGHKIAIDDIHHIKKKHGKR